MSGFRLYLPGECTGKDGYPSEWHETLKHAVREAAGHRCIRCGHPYKCGVSKPDWSACDEQCTHRGPYRYERLDGTWGEADEHERVNTAGQVVHLQGLLPVQAYYRVLTVHHLDGVKGNCRWWNLVSLCQRCHLTVQGRVRMERVWPWEHSLWFQPNVAGYYAHTYLGEALTREQTMARLDELLALEQSAGAIA